MGLKALTSLSTSRSSRYWKSKQIKYSSGERERYSLCKQKKYLFLCSCINISLPFKYLEFVDKHRQNWISWTWRNHNGDACKTCDGKRKLFTETKSQENFPVKIMNEKKTINGKLKRNDWYNRLTLLPSCHNYECEKFGLFTLFLAS